MIFVDFYLKTNQVGQKTDYPTVWFVATSKDGTWAVSVLVGLIGPVRSDSVDGPVLAGQLRSTVDLFWFLDTTVQFYLRKVFFHTFVPETKKGIDL